MRNRFITHPNDLLSVLTNIPFEPKIFKMDGKEIPYMCLEVPFEINDIFSFLEAQKLYPKVYWENPEDGIVAGIGKVLQLDHLPLFDSTEGPRFYGGSDFMKRTRNTWKHFPEKSYFLPLIEIEKKTDKTLLRLNRIQKDLKVDLMPETAISLAEKVINRFDFPSFPEWEQKVQRILQGIARKDFLKVTLARCSRFECDRVLSPYAVLKKLKEKNRFSFQFSPEKAFIGTSPESLYRRRKTMIKSAAVAGTRPRGKTKQKDQLLMKDLLYNSKEQYEFQIVSNMIKAALIPLCKKLELQDKKVLKTPTVQHLYRSFRGTLKEGVDDVTLIETLHPTPAVGGFPKKEAFREIRKSESFDRGWYAAPVGWVSASEAHHLVGIRSALIEKNTLRLFSGTGIVSGSIPCNEWDELEHKIKQYKACL